MRVLGTLKATIPAALMVATIASAAVAEYPERAITLVVPTAAGGGVDTQARALAPKMEEILGQPVQVVNRKGAGGTVGLQSLVLPAEPDGYTIAASASVSMIENPLLQNLPFGPQDLTIIGTTGQFQAAIVASANAPYKTWEEFVAYARENPGTRWYALGQVTVAVMNALAKAEGLEIAIIPGQGGATLAPTLIAGDADVSVSGGVHTPFVESGDLVVLLNLLGDGSLMANPEVPSAFELYGVSMENNLVISGPKGLSEDVVNRLEEAVRAASESDRHKEVMDSIQYPIVYRDSDTATEKLTRQYKGAKSLLGK
ncbi:tripartite tricarboxylate transporter substrate binding protein [Marinovum sp. 2_MG-2023]|uniref:tripartite tricarboxylate transporter substrate binding protein n=1 Tax=unclassified Marinovum TaxID=2647166 RepID=UPI0026E15A7D|nr:MULTISPECIES: tripartite tricarboxylate transporter substrate binding protein [unclassified Marinovum]MDO6732804.1 tripartite tricarboxylate transporter substrate binding protein [Marinovum sp. 2_MG-2023]MDO6782073.1 tripartite tricarboxylate transporter substrate binding protein [Marinovum sp. 1_MG-2023]